MSSESTDARWIAVVGAPDGERDQVVGALEERMAPRVFDGVDQALDAVELMGAQTGSGDGGIFGDGPPGLVVLASTIPAEDALRAVDRSADGAFVVAQVTGRREANDEEPGADVHLRPLSPGYEEPLDQLLARWDPEDPHAGDLLELRNALARVRRVRHDVNNPLTAALAEVQLLLMDVEEDEARDSLEVVQEQLRRIRDRVQELAQLRPPTT